MPLGPDPRKRGRRRPLLLVLLAAAVLAWVASLGVAYRVGTTEQATRAQRLAAELDLQGRLVHDLSRRAAMAEQELGRARQELARHAPPAVPAAPAPSRSELETLGSVIDRRLREGLTVAELRAAVEAAASARHCAGAPEVRQFLARTPVTRDPGVARFLSGRVAVTGSGSPVRNAAGRPEAWIDVREPVELKIEVGGATTTAAGVLPVRHTVVREDKEYRFEARPHSRRGFIEVALTVCNSA
jgi:hypothetical protein